jgi:hypothetical protein
MQNCLREEGAEARTMWGTEAGGPRCTAEGKHLRDGEHKSRGLPQGELSLSADSSGDPKEQHFL